MSEQQPTILIIEDELQIRRFLCTSLSGHGYALLEASTGQEGVEQAAQLRPDGVILDLGLPDMDGQEVLQRIRSWSAVPVVILTARGQEQDKIALLDAGADDYLTKPFGVNELLARLRVALRHAHGGGEAQPVIEAGPLRVDLARREVTVDGREVRLTPTEFKLLALLGRHAGKVLTHRQILREVWGPHASEAHYVRVHMAELRKKIEPEPARPRLLVTEPGVGYRLRDRVE